MRISDWSSDVCSSDLGKRSEHRGAAGLSLHRPAGALKTMHRVVAVEPDDQPVGGAPRLLQQRDMAGMPQVEAADGEGDALVMRTEERRVGKEGCVTGSSRGSSYH